MFGEQTAFSVDASLKTLNDAELQNSALVVNASHISKTKNQDSYLIAACRWFTGKVHFEFLTVPLESSVGGDCASTLYLRTAAEYFCPLQGWTNGVT